MVRCGNPGCDKLFFPKSHIHTYCSDACRKAARGKGWKRVRAAALERDSYTCQDCRCQPSRCEAHHLTPVCLGGTNSLDNLVTLCPGCHRERHKSWEYTSGLVLAA